MKKLMSILAALLLTVAAQGQTLNVEVGSVTYQFPAAQAGEMTYDDGTTLTVLGKTFALSDVSQVYVDETDVADNTVRINYSGTAATVVVAGNIAQYITPTVSGAHVGIVQGDVASEVTYTLTGSSTDGEFYMAGSYKCTVELSGVTLTNTNPVFSGAAVYIKNGKRIDISVKKDTENTLTDCANPSADLAQKGCLWVKGHAEFKGKGTLNVYGRYSDAHAIKTGEYMTVKNCTVNVLSAGKDGLHVNEYFQMTSGTLSVSGVGDDAVAAELDGTTNTGELADHDGEDSGNIYIDGGTLTLSTTAAGAKGLKSDSTVVVNDGTITITAAGGVDTSDSSDPAYVAGISAGKFVQSDGTIAMTIRGTAGRGVKAYDIETNGGELSITNSAGATTISSDVKGAKGLKGLNIALNAGTITITMSGAAGKGIRAGDGTKSTSGGGWRAPGGGGGWNPGGGGGGGQGGGSSWSNVTGSYTQGTSDGSGPTLTVTTTGSASSSSSAKAIKAICAITIYGGTTEVNTSTNGAEGLESKTSIDIQGGQHYFKCYDDCINSAGKIYFNGGVTVCYSNGNDAVDSNAGTTGAITIGNGAIFAYSTKGSPEEGLDCDNNSYIQITGKGIAISAGGAQGGGYGSSTISGAAQGYAFVTSSISYAANRYYTLADSSGNNLVTYSFPASCSSTLGLFTATGMVKGSTYTVKYSTTAPTDAATAWHGLYLGSSHKGTTSVTSFTAK